MDGTDDTTDDTTDESVSLSSAGQTQYYTILTYSVSDRERERVM